MQVFKIYCHCILSCGITVLLLIVDVGVLKLHFAIGGSEDEGVLKEVQEREAFGKFEYLRE